MTTKQTTQTTQTIEVGTRVKARTADPHMVRAGLGEVEGEVFKVYNDLYLVRWGDDNKWFQYDLDQLEAVDDNKPNKRTK